LDSTTLASIDTRATGMPLLDAQANLRRALRSHALGRMLSRQSETRPRPPLLAKPAAWVLGAA
jgi:hypothetical protein